MVFKYSHASVLILVVMAATLLDVCMANKGWGFNTNNTGWGWGWGFNNHPLNETKQSPRKINVGGSENWHFGFNYSDWAFQNAPFYFNDTLVFKYDPPSNATFPHSVYLFPDLWSYLKCDIKRAKMIANATQGGGEGFEFVLKKWTTHYFACGEHDGIHCKVGGMKFMVIPLFPWHF